MLKNLKPIMASVALALTLTIPQMVHSMEVESAAIKSQAQQTRELTLTDKYNTFKAFLIYQAMKDSLGENFPIEIPGSVISDLLHELTKNLVLDGELIYTNPENNEKTCIKIKNLLNKEGTLDLSTFGDAAKYLVITTDPTRFFKLKEENVDKIVILFAPWFLITENLKTTCTHFESIMKTWDGTLAPIGIFWRYGNWENKNWFDYLTNQNIKFISEYNLHYLWKHTPLSRGALVPIARALDLLPTFGTFILPISCFVLNQNQL